MTAHDDGRSSVRRVTVLALFALLAVALGAPGCGEEVEPPAPAPGPPAWKLREPDPSKLRSELRGTVDLPADYPKDAPIYPGSKVNNAGHRNGRVTAVFSTEDSTEQVAAYVRAKFATEGWSDIAADEMPNGSVLHAHKDGRDLSVLVSYMDEGTEYELTIIIVAVDPPSDEAAASP